MFEKYDALTKAHETMFRLANEACCKMLEAETPEEVTIYEAQHNAFLKAAEVINDQILEVLDQL